MGLYNQQITRWPKAQSRDIYGRLSHGAAEVLRGRWEDVNEEFIASDGSEQISRSVAYLDGVDVAVGDTLALGDQSGRSVAAAEGAIEVRAFSKIPNVAATSFVRKAIG